MSKRPLIPYPYTHIPNVLLTDEFLDDYEMIRFIIYMMRRISTSPTKIPLKSQRRHLALDPFEFMYGRKSFSKLAGISEKVARTRLEQLVGLGYVEEVVSKRASTFRVYRLVKDAFCRNLGQHHGQQIDQKEDLNLDHKQETRTQEERNIKGTFNVAIAPPLLQKENDDLNAISAYCEASGLDISRSSIERWIILYGIEKISGTIPLLISSKNKVRKHEAWMESALKNNYFENGKNSEINRRFAGEFKEAHKWDDLTITKQYCRHEPSKKEY